FVPRDDQLVRREVRLGQATTDLVEVREGLTEGEEVALDLPSRGGRPRPLSGFSQLDWVASASSPKVAAPPKARPPDEPSPDSSNRRKNRRKSADGKEKSRGRAIPQS